MRTHILPFADPGAKIRLMFEDEASFGRISEVAQCWAPGGIRPLVPYHVVREHMQVFGAVDPIEGDSCFIIAPKCNTAWMNAFLEVLSKRFETDYILLVMDNATWHKSKTLQVPDNIRLFYLPPRTPEMNPIEQVWPEVRLHFKNKLFKTLSDVVDRLCLSLNSLSHNTLISITGRSWIMDMF